MQYHQIMHKKAFFMFIKTKARDVLELPEGIPLARRRHCS